MTVANLPTSSPTNPIPDLSSTQSAVISTGKLKSIILRREAVPRFSFRIAIERSIGRMLSCSIQEVSNLVSKCKLTLNHFDKSKARFTPPTPYTVSQNFWQKPASRSVEYEFYTVSQSGLGIEFRLHPILPVIFLFGPFFKCSKTDNFPSGGIENPQISVWAGNSRSCFERSRDSRGFRML